MNKIVFFPLLSVLLFFTACNIQPEGVQLVSPDEVEELIDKDVRLIDVRTKQEFEMGHIRGAENISFTNDNFEEVIQGLNKSEPVIVYCQRGGRSGRCASRLAELGFTKIYDLDGGMSKWVSSGNKIE